MGNNVSYRELVKEIKDSRKITLNDIEKLRTEMNKNFRRLESSLDQKVDVTDFKTLRSTVRVNKSFRVYLTGAVGVVTGILGIIGGRLLDFILGRQ